MPFFNDSNIDEFEEIHLKIQEANDFIFIIPEWGGMILGKLKKIITNIRPKAYRT